MPEATAAPKRRARRSTGVQVAALVEAMKSVIVNTPEHELAVLQIAKAGGVQDVLTFHEQLKQYVARRGK